MPRANALDRPVPFVFNCGADLLAEARTYAEHHGCSVAAVIRRALRLLFDAERSVHEFEQRTGRRFTLDDAGDLHIP